MNIEISKIKIGNRRALGDVTELAESIKEIGLLNPITVTKDYTLIAGHHRLKAFEALGIDLIPIRIVDCTALQAELAEIDENLIRNNGTELEQCMSLARRKEIYLELHPETKHGAQGGGNKGNGTKVKTENDTMSFSDDTSKKTGKSKRTTERKVSIGEKLGGMQDAIKAAGIDDSQKDLTDLAKLKSPDQIKAVLAIVANDSVSVKLAIRQLSLSNKKAAYFEEIAEETNSVRKISIDTTEKKFRVLYADPPWSYSDKQDTDLLGGAEKHYSTMSITQLCELPIKKIIDNDAVLFMWVTSPLLEECFEVIKAWGFSYKSSFVWDKIAHNMGHYNSVRHELLLICTRGSCTPDVKKLHDSVISIERGRHSEKPKEFIEMIDSMYGYGNKLEMFARDEKMENWHVWGNEV